MSPGRHSTPDESALPSFTGDVPDDLALAGEVVRRRFVWIFAQGITGFGVAFALILAWTAGVGALVTFALPGGPEDHAVPVVLTLAGVAMVSGVSSLVRLVPGRVRFALGALPAAASLLAATTAGGVYDPSLDYVPGAFALVTLVTGATYVIVAGLRFWANFKHRLAEIDAPRPPGAQPGL